MAEGSVDILEAGDPAPSFALQGTDEQTYSLETFEDHDALLVVFTCNHCPYAQAKQPALNDIATTYENVAVIGINPNDAEEYPEDSFDRMQAAVSDGTIALDAYLRDDTQDVAAAYGAVCTPDNFLFRKRDGTFELAYHGRIDDALAPDEEPSEEPGFLMREAIEAVLDEEPIDLPFEPSRGCSIKWRLGNEPAYWDDL